jgi:hypothetical protein
VSLPYGRQHVDDDQSFCSFFFFFLADLILHRDEALSAIIAVETFDLSLSVGQMHIEEEFGGTGVFSMFSKRISSQLSQLIVMTTKHMSNPLTPVNRSVSFSRIFFIV